MSLLVAIDIGTTNVKCVLARPNMQVLTEATQEYGIHAHGIACFEQNCEDWWKNVI